MCSRTFGASIGGGTLRSLLCHHVGQLSGMSAVIPIFDTVHTTFFVCFSFLEAFKIVSLYLVF